MNQVYNLDESKLVTNPAEILQVQAEFYQKLYTVEEHAECKIEIKPSRQISQEQKMQLDSEITLEEVQSCIRSMARNKTPVIDGIPIEFYACFWRKLKKHFMELVQHILKLGVCHKTGRMGVISLIPKIGRDLKFVKDWRPIVLLNLDYKVVSKVLASCMKLVLKDIVSEDQTGFISGRNIAENLKILDIVDYTEEHQIPGVIVSVDFLKAFDRV